MPSPIGHALGGAIVGLALSARRSADVAARSRWSGRWAAVLWQRGVIVPAAAAVLPDVDFLWGRHNMETHSLGAAVAAAAAIWLWRRGDGRLTGAVGLAWATHVLFDWLGSDDTPPLGVMAWWPVTSAFVFAHAYVFEAISRRYWLEGFWAHNLWAVATELAMLAPLAVALTWWRGRATQRV